MLSESIYLDYNATTPCDARVVEKMLPFFSDWYGNPANGLHIQGRKSAEAVANAREQVASLIAARSGEIFFTSGATESNNLAIFGATRFARNGERRRIITTAVEHKAVLLPFERLADQGFELYLLPVDPNGRVIIEAARDLINSNTLLVSLQAANNEVGTIQPVAEISNIAHENGALVHCDAAQVVGKVPVDVRLLGVDLLSISAHKVYGPKGVGCLYIRGGTRGIALESQIIGGGQENGLRSGTTNVPGIVGFGEACAISSVCLEQDMTRLTQYRDQLEDSLLAEIMGITINARGAERIPNTSSVTFPGVDADAFLLNMPQLMLGTGSACTSGTIEPSHVLQAMGVSRKDSFSTVRISLGRYTTAENISIAAKTLVKTYMGMDQ